MNRDWYGKYSFISLILAGLCLLSGCSVGLGFGVGPVSLYFGVYADPELTSPQAKRYVCHLQEFLQKHGYQITPLKDEHTIGFTARRLADPSKINPDDPLLLSLEKISSKTSADGKQLRIRTKLNLQTLETANIHADSSIHYNLKLNFSQPPIASNADRVENKGRELEWSFKSASVQPIEIDFAS